MVRNYIILHLFIGNACQQSVIKSASWLKEHNVK